MAVPTFISAGAIANDLTGAASVTPTPPAHLADDILIAVGFNQAAAAASTVTAGWTNFRASGGARFQFWWKRATGPGTAGPTITAASTDQFALVYVFRGCIATGTPMEIPNGNGETTSTTPSGNFPGTTLGPDRLGVIIAANDDDTTYASGLPPSGWTLASDASDATGTQARFTVLTKGFPIAGLPDSPVVGTLTTAEIWFTATFALIPAPVPYTPPPRSMQPFLAQ